MYPLGDIVTTMMISVRGRRMVETFEGLRRNAYLDQHGVPTIGYGHTAGVKMGDVCTKEQADTWCDEDLGFAEDVVTRDVVVSLNQNEFDALVSFVFNEGLEHFEQSHLLKMLNQGDRVGASEQFGKWIYVAHVVNMGLIRRRETERKLFLEAVCQP